MKKKIKINLGDHGAKRKMKIEPEATRKIETKNGAKRKITKKLRDHGAKRKTKMIRRIMRRGGSCTSQRKPREILIRRLKMGT